MHGRGRERYWVKNNRNTQTYFFHPVCCLCLKGIKNGVSKIPLEHIFMIFLCHSPLLPKKEHSFLLPLVTHRTKDIVPVLANALSLVLVKELDSLFGIF